MSNNGNIHEDYFVGWKFLIIDISFVSDNRNLFLDVGICFYY